MISFIASNLTLSRLATLVAFNYCVGSTRNLISVGQTVFKVTFVTGKIVLQAAQYAYEASQKKALPPVKPLEMDDFEQVKRVMYVTAEQFSDMILANQIQPDLYDYIIDEEKGHAKAD